MKTQSCLKEVALPLCLVFCECADIVGSVLTQQKKEQTLLAQQILPTPYSARINVQLAV